MDVKDAIQTAKGWLRETLSDEVISNLGLEEIIGPMSAIGTKRTSRSRRLMSAFGGKADIR